MPFKINLKNVLMYVIYAVSLVFANFAVRGVPLSLGFMCVMLACGTNIIAVPVLYVLAGISELNLIYSLITLFQGAFLGLIAFLYRRSGRKIKFEAIAYILIALAPYIAFAPCFQDGFLIDNGYAVRAIASALVIIFGFFCFKTVYSLLFRLQRCRLREDELVCIAVCYAVCGSGAVNLLGASAYICLSAGAVAFFARLFRSPACIICALALSAPCALQQFDLLPITAYVAIATLALLFSGAGRFASGAVTGATTAVYMYLTGRFDCAVPLIVIYALLLFLGVLLPSLPSEKKYSALKRRLFAEEILTDTAVVRSRRRTGERLYRISEVFREIECAFISIDDSFNDDSARENMLAELKDKCCTGCERAQKCKNSGVYAGFKKLIDAGCVKGKVNLIDLPSEMTAGCSRPADVLSRLNFILSEYRRYMTETENARAGRTMLAEQAHGVAEVMKSCAVDLSREQSFEGLAQNVKRALSAQGVCCPEVYIDESGNELCAVVVGKANLKLMTGIITKTLNRRFALKDKIVYDGQRACLVFTAPPALDASFGVAYAIKNGEKVSGDTHSVIKINERKFLMALSDGMGSGEYAKNVSQSAISLIEAFYRAEMPADTILTTINKLLSFNRDERFTCIDIASVNLDTGRADFIKIGSPAGIILREGEIKVLESTSLPMGILENLRPTVCTEMLKAGDLVVFMSDGITSAFPSNADLYEFLQNLRPLNPQSLADKILAGALDKTGHKVTDDMTALCVRIFDNSD